MMPAQTNTTDPATLAAAEGLAALGVGDTALARQKYAEAGAILEREMKARHGGGEKQLLRFLAATQYYKGGDYKKAQELANKIDAGALPKNVRGLLPQFLKDVKLRVSPDYPAGVQKTLLRQQREKQPKDLLTTLQAHPYVLKPGAMAFLRAVACEEIGEFRAAALFFARVARDSSCDMGLLLTTSAFPLHLATHHRSRDAWEYVQHQVELLPHPVTFTTAAIVALFQAMSSDAQERRRYFEQQLRYLDRAWDAYQQLPEAQQNHPELRRFIGFGFEGGALTWERLGDRQRAKDTADRAILFRPDYSRAWVARGSATYPSETAVADFKKAVELNETAYTPYYFLAHDALQRGDFRSASLWCLRALERNPSRRIEAQLSEWLAICRDRLGASRDEVDALFRKAQELDPNDEEISENYRIFKEFGSGQPSKLPRWTTRLIQRGDETAFPDFASHLPVHRDREEAVRETLLVGGN
jgi:tetratricopeptide (TPR) repeat protein